MKTVLQAAHFAQGFLLSPLPRAGGQDRQGSALPWHIQGQNPLGFTAAPGQAQAVLVLWQSSSGSNCTTDESGVTNFNYMLL